MCDVIIEPLPKDWREVKSERQRKFLNECTDVHDNLLKASPFNGDHEFRRVSPVCFERKNFE